jgi:Fe-S-cluster containining protein
MKVRISIPAVPCEEGCSDCCCPVPFSKREWAAIPPELKKGLDIRLSINFRGYLMVIPFSPGFLPPNIPKIVPQKDVGLIMRGLHEDEITDSCPFCVEHRCAIYQIRPLICRIHGTVRPDNPFDAHYRLTCPHNKVPLYPLLNGQIDQLYLAWMENRRTW